MNMLSKITNMQNRMLDLEVTNQAYNKDIQSSRMRNLSISYTSHSDFYKGKSFWIAGGGIVQMALFGASEKYSPFISEIFGKIAGEVANKSITTYHDNLSPQFTSVQTTEQKKIDLLVQSANTETNKSHQLQQAFQNAKETYSQLLKK